MVRGMCGFAWGTIVLLGACSSTTTDVSTQAVQANASEVFWAKNTLAAQTPQPSAARFRNFEVFALSTGERVYCGEMASMAASGLPAGYTPFYMRSRAGEAVALNWRPDSAAFSARKCSDARAGKLRIDLL